MSTRTTHKDLQETAALLSKMTGRKLEVHWAYGRPRLEEMHDNGGVSDVSPRLPMGEMAEWLWAFEKGLSYAPHAKE